MTAESSPQRKHWKEPGVDYYNAENHGTARAEEQNLVPTVLIEVVTTEEWKGNSKGEVYRGGKEVENSETELGEGLKPNMLIRILDI